jgi:EAL domain-containing protein (putative c-di-GMP-specific phosphodiesterase class I)
VAVIARRALEALSGPFLDPTGDLSFTASIGIAVTANPHADAGELLIQADVAMYEAKSAGRNCFRIYDPDRHAPEATWQDFGSSLRKAIEEGQLFVVYQPLFSLEDRSLRGAEALVRWRHPQQGVVLPADFIPLAEERGLIDLVDTFVLDEACRQLAEWLGTGQVPPDFTIAVNLSARRLTDPSLAGRVASALERHGLPPSHLCIEMTEASLIGRLQDAELALGALSQMGVRLALDDFGTCSTLSYLRRLKVDMLKVDRHFVDQIANGRNRDVIASIAAIAHALGMAAVGVGIERESQMVALAATGYDQGQGFFLAEPLLPEHLPALCSPDLPPGGGGPAARVRPRFRVG